MTSGRTLQHSIVVALLFAMSWTFVAARPASAATIVVDGVTCTLADAITAANTDTATGGCPAGSGADTLDLVADITLASRLPVIVSEVTLLGNGHTVSRLPSAPAFRILEIGWYGNATIDSVTVTGGEDDEGGGISVDSALLYITDSTIEENAADSGGGLHCRDCQVFLSRTIVRNNSATYSGGGIRIRFTLPTTQVTDLDRSLPGKHTYCGLGYYTAIIDSTITDNTAQVGGGVSYRGGSHIVEGSTIANNHAVKGGGLASYRSAECFDSTTISGNTATQEGGGIYNGSFVLKHEASNTPNYGAPIDLSNSTVVDNSSPMGAGLYNYHDGPPYPGYTARVRPFNTILAAQADGADCVNVNGTVVESQGYNIEGATSCGFTASGDQQNVSAAQLNLAPLANNGGPTWTHALIPGSAAIDQGNCPDVTTDQRGFPRPVDIPGVPNTADGCDVGAYEAEAPLAVTVLTFEAEDLDSNSPPLFLIVAVLVTSLLLVTRWKNGRRVAANRHLTMPHSSQER